MHRDDVIAFSPAMREAIGTALDVAPAPTTVLLTGESGVGKEVVALHSLDEPAHLAAADAAAVRELRGHGGWRGAAARGDRFA